MASYCDNCGKKLKPEAKFCDSCGATVKQNEKSNNESGISCPNCGTLIPIGSVACTTCGHHIYQKDFKNELIAIYIVTIIISLFIPIIGFIAAVICAAYLFTRHNSDLNKHGIIIVFIPIVVFLVSFLVRLMWLY